MLPAILILSFITMAFGVVSFYYGVMRPRLVLGDEFLEMRTGPGSGTISGQLPIRNIESAEVVRQVQTDDRGQHQHTSSGCCTCSFAGPTMKTRGGRGSTARGANRS